MSVAHDRMLTDHPMFDDNRLEVAMDRLRRDPEVRHAFLAMIVENTHPDDLAEMTGEAEAGNYSAAGALLVEIWQTAKREPATKGWLAENYGSEHEQG